MSERKSLDEILRIIEETPAVPFGENFHARYFELAFEQYKEQGDEHKKLECSWDALLWHFRLGEKGEKRFLPFMEGTAEDGTVNKFPNFDETFSLEQLAYYRRRLNESRNATLRSRYADFLWEKEKKPELARAAVTAYLESLSVLGKEQHTQQGMVDALTRSLDLSAFLRDQALLSQVVNEFWTVAEQFVKEKSFGYLDSLVEGLVESKAATSFWKPQEWITLLATAASIERSDPEPFFLQRRLLGGLLKLWKLVGDVEQQRKVLLEIGKSFEDEAEWKRKNYPSGNSIAAHFYEKALEHYHNSGGVPKEKLDAIKVLILEALQAAERTDFKEVSGEMTFPIKDIEDYAQPYLERPLEEALVLLAIDNRPFASWEDALEAAEQTMKDSISWLFPLSVQRKGMHLYDVSGRDERLEYEAIRHVERHYNLVCHVFVPRVLESFRQKDERWYEEATRFLASSPNVANGRIEFLARGLKAVAEGDHVVAIHCLCFQVEGVLRDIFANVGLPTTSFRSGETRARDLSDLLTACGQIRGIDTDLLRVMSIFLNDVKGTNLRNNIAHGILDAHELSMWHGILLMLLLFKLAGWKFQRGNRTEEQIGSNEGSTLG